MGRRALLAVAVAGVALAGTLIALAVTDDGPTHPSQYPPIAERDATQLLAKTVRLAQTGDFARLCRTVSVWPHGQCEFLLEGVESDGMLPGPEAPKVLDAKRLPATDNQREYLVLRVAGARADGSRYEADFPVTWDDRQPELRSPTAIYWTGVRFASAEPCDGPQPENTVCAQAEVAPPPR